MNRATATLTVETSALRAAMDELGALLSDLGPAVPDHLIRRCAWLRVGKRAFVFSHAAGGYFVVEPSAELLSVLATMRAMLPKEVRTQ